ncbi:MAG: HisA/HisF-related TIM barrel protein [Acidimicrobiales bacterium]|jgi:phosphoribosylformimino-5-aminoimidazole carboxamide ribotide isomerase
MDLYPAIDIRDGGAVRLTQGDFDRQSEYGDPLALAARFAAAGARWLHVVDLDAARSGEPVNRATVVAIARSVGIPVETGGGVRTGADVDELLEGGLARVVLGTAALDDPGLVRRATAAHPGRVALGLDYRRTADGRAEVAVRGWEQATGRTVGDLLDEVAGAGLAAVIATSIDRDGTLAGPDLDGLRAVLSSTGLPVIASGGVGSVADVEALARLEAPGPSGGPPRRLLGAITGKALVDGRMTVEEGVDACARCG